MSKRISNIVILTIAASMGCSHPTRARPLTDTTHPTDATVDTPRIDTSDLGIDRTEIDAGFTLRDVAMDHPHTDSNSPHDVMVVSPVRAPERVTAGLCTQLATARNGHFVSMADLTTSFLQGDDLLASANRSPLGTLSPGYAPSDLVDLRTLAPRSPMQCNGGNDCLRQPAAQALRPLIQAMRQAGFEAKIASAYRGYSVQCYTFFHWAYGGNGTFCGATTQSALAGHSQHQLGTTVDLFSRAWSRHNPFRPGFGCTEAGRWLAEHSYEYGWVVPYVIHPDDRIATLPCAARSDLHAPINPRTGYGNEPWHLRYIGIDNAQQFYRDLVASGIGTPNEITLEQWLRRRTGLLGDTDLPVCDGCNCGACATLAVSAEHTPCGEHALHLDTTGHPMFGQDVPTIERVRVRAPTSTEQTGAVIIEVQLRVPPRVVTQTPIVNATHGYRQGESVTAWAPYPRTAPRAFQSLLHAWRVGIEHVGESTNNQAFPYQSGLALAHHGTLWNRANVYFPAAVGNVTVTIPVELTVNVRQLRVALLRDGQVHQPQTVEVPAP